ncbi:MAG: hypothetical protein HY903_05790 [Deltaproteobacteria bacterium]|nr:hypothetical protein [Deltaproteobacteria bacterium]
MFDRLRLIEPFLLGSGSAAAADLAYLAVLGDALPLSFDKWRDALRLGPVVGYLGTDIHRNVNVSPVCTGSAETACRFLAALHPGALALLLSGGPVMMVDGDRLDSYDRGMRWLQNRVLARELTPQALRDAIRVGRSYGIWTVFGDAPGFSARPSSKR